MRNGIATKAAIAHFSTLSVRVLKIYTFVTHLGL